MNTNTEHAKSNRRQLNPKKLLLSKWTAQAIVAKQKHFIVTKIMLPEDPQAPIVEVEIEAVYSRQKQVIAWRGLLDEDVWKQGWV